MADRQYDLVLYGATGFTGKIGAEYMARKPHQFQSSFKWAIAGRDGKKLEAVKTELCAINEDLSDLGVIIADSFDVEALDKMTQSAKAVVSFVGPYTRYGSKLVESCVKNGCHYADLTGEFGWMKDMMDAYHEEATSKRVTLIHSAGFDSVPPDWGAYAIATHFKETLNEQCAGVLGVMWDGKGGFSGGTAASGFETAAPENVEKYRKALADPQYFNPLENKNNLDKPEIVRAVWDKGLNIYLGSWIMAACNGLNVRRTNGLVNYGPRFTYREVQKCDYWVYSLGDIFIQFVFQALASNTWTRGLVGKMLPKPGTGPSKELQRTGFCHVKFFGLSETSESRAECNIHMKGDPGYSATARMIVEAGICLARGVSTRYGFQTTASCLGQPYFDQLLQNGFSCDIKTLSEDDKFFPTMLTANSSKA